MLNSNPLGHAKVNTRKLVSQYFAQRLPADRWEAMRGCIGITFRPGGFKDDFAQKSILPAGTATMFQLHYEVQANHAGEPRLRIPIVAIRGCDLPTGGVCYDEQSARLRVDLSYRPHVGARGCVIDPERNPSLLDTALRIDKACQRAVAMRRRLQRNFLYPRVLLSFTKELLPTYRDTPALRQLAARRLQVPVRRLGSNGELLLDRLLRETWDQAVLPPTHPRNWTETYLVPADLCPNSYGFFRIYEDFTDLLGVPTWNPARDSMVDRFHNPAKEIFGILGLGDQPDFNEKIPDDLIVRMLSEMRSRTEGFRVNFSDEDLLDGITSPEQSLIAWSRVLPKLRDGLTVFANQCSTDHDLKAAVLQPSEPLWLRFACRVQVSQCLDTTSVSPIFPDRDAERIPEQPGCTSTEGNLLAC
ncbi:hypothetical protein [Anatilimnocola floriformis]|uniref:hypothetical protein n=1 Tax=Anatilimnocola floriformis TaxID=2948575 RepID=UPI0020C56981|nr:hypothetical protein [Anatilimnocola floriformis]